MVRKLKLNEIDTRTPPSCGLISFNTEDHISAWTTERLRDRELYLYSVSGGAWSFLVCPVNFGNFSLLSG